MSLQQVALRQYRSIVDTAAAQTQNLVSPPEGWICTTRKALGMSGAQLARRLGFSRAQVSKTEKAEVHGNVTLKTIQRMAEAMGCRFVYAIVPDRPTEEMLIEHARRKAIAIVKRTNEHMALEDQTLTDEQLKFEIERLTREIATQMSSSVWDE